MSYMTYWFFFTVLKQAALESRSWSSFVERIKGLPETAHLALYESALNIWAPNGQQAGIARGIGETYKEDGESDSMTTHQAFVLLQDTLRKSSSLMVVLGTFATLPQAQLRGWLTAVEPIVTEHELIGTFLGFDLEEAA